MRNKKGQFIKGYNASPETQFKKGQFSGNKHPMWQGGKEKMKIGYVLCYAPNHPRAYRNKVYEHILIAEKKIGRFLKDGECVHHINRIKDDNNPENLIVLSSHREHCKLHRGEYRKERVTISRDYLEKEYTVSEKPIASIAKNLKLSTSTIWKKLARYGIKIRSRNCQKAH